MNCKCIPTSIRKHDKGAQHGHSTNINVYMHPRVETECCSQGQVYAKDIVEITFMA